MVRKRDTKPAKVIQTPALKARKGSLASPAQPRASVSPRPSADPMVNLMIADGARRAWQEYAEALAEVSRWKAHGPLFAETHKRFRAAKDGLRELGFLAPCEAYLNCPDELAEARQADVARYGGDWGAEVEAGPKCGTRYGSEEDGELVCGLRAGHPGGHAVEGVEGLPGGGWRRS